MNTLRFRNLITAGLGLFFGWWGFRGAPGGNPIYPDASRHMLNGAMLYDSPVICEYLDSVGNRHDWFDIRLAGEEAARQLEAMKDGAFGLSSSRNRPANALIGRKKPGHRGLRAWHGKYS
jgi:hypothetical protein